MTSCRNIAPILTLLICRDGAQASLDASWVSEYCITSLSAQSWQYRDRRKQEVVTILYSYRMTSRVLHSAHYHRHHCTHQAFEEFGALYMQNLDDKHPTRPGFEPSSLPLSFVPQLDGQIHPKERVTVLVTTNQCCFNVESASKTVDQH